MRTFCLNPLLGLLIFALAVCIRTISPDEIRLFSVFSSTSDSVSSAKFARSFAAVPNICGQRLL